MAEIQAQPKNILSPQILQSLKLSGDDKAVIAVPRKRKRKHKSGSESKTPSRRATRKELLQLEFARKLEEKQTKNAERRLKHIQAKRSREISQTDIIEKLGQTRLTDAEKSLLNRSGCIGKAITTREKLSRLMKKEKSGAPLTEEESAMLYVRAAASDSSESSEEDSEDENPEKRPRSDSNDADIEQFPEIQPELTTKQSSFSSMQVEVEEDEKKEEQTFISPSKPFSSQSLIDQFKSLQAKWNKPISAKPATRENDDDDVWPIKPALPPAVIEIASIPSVPPLSEVVPQLEQQEEVNMKKRTVIVVDRPESVEETRSNLPICAYETEIIEAISYRDVVFLSSETGSGKSTQVPQFLYEAGFGSAGIIGCTQPRRVAVTSICHRVAYEMSDNDAEMLVGYQVRFDSSRFSNERTRIKFMTDGILLNEITSDLLLRKYSVIIIDEAHEMTVNCEVLIGLLSKSIILRKQACIPLKLVIMSASTSVIDSLAANPRLFSSVSTARVAVPGKAFPVTIHFSNNCSINHNDGVYVDQCYDKICRLHSKLALSDSHPDGILVFLAGKKEVIDICSRLDKRFSDSVSVFPLYGSMSLDQQQKVFDYQKPSEMHRLIVVATNVAETSVTIPGIRYVVDSGREKRRVLVSYASKKNDDDENDSEATTTVGGSIQKYEIGWISRDSAEQRSGRAGRLCSGHCYRLYSSGIFLNESMMPLVSPPEIARTQLEDIAMLLYSTGIGSLKNFPFVNQVPSYLLDSADNLLIQLGLVVLRSNKITLTSIGQVVVSLACGLPVRLAKMIVLGVIQHRLRGHKDILQSVIHLVSRLACNSHCDVDFDISSERLPTPESRDIMNMLKKRLNVSSGSSNYLSDHSSIKKIYLNGFLDQIAKLTADMVYQRYDTVLIVPMIVCSCNEKELNRLKLFPSSALIGQYPEWVCYQKIVKTDYNSYMFGVISITSDELKWISEFEAQKMDWQSNVDELICKYDVDEVKAVIQPTFPNTGISLPIVIKSFSINNPEISRIKSQWFGRYLLSGRCDVQFMSDWNGLVTSQAGLNLGSWTESLTAVRFVASNKKAQNLLNLLSELKIDNVQSFRNCVTQESISALLKESLRNCIKTDKRAEFDLIWSKMTQQS